MWMLLGLVGMLVASSMVDVFVPAGASEDIDDSDSGLDGDAALSDESSTQTGDMLEDIPDSTEIAASDDPPSDLEPTETPGPESQPIESESPNEDGLPMYRAPDPSADGLADDWYYEEFLSTDTPLQSPPDYYISLDEDGDQAAGDDGNDTLVGGAGGDWLDGQDGDDGLIGHGGNDTLIGGRGADTLTGGAGDDSLVSGSGNGLLIGGSGNDALIGGEDNDTLIGGDDNDTLEGGYGDDVLVAGAGNDVVFGGAGNDTIFGFTPDQTGRDSDGADVINAGDGDDVLVLGSGDTASGGAGADTFVVGSWIDPDEPALITDFDPETDVFSIAYDASGAPPELSAAYDAKAGGLQIMADGEVVAFLSGIEALDLSHVTLLAVEGNPNA